jgi:hypothetical protein
VGLVPVRDEQRPAAAVGIVQHPGGRAQPPRRRDHLPFQVPGEVAAARGHRALGRHRHPPGQVGQEPARVEIVRRARNSHGPGHNPHPITSPASRATGSATKITPTSYPKRVRGPL